MPEILLPLSVTNQIIRQTKRNTYVADVRNYMTAQISFSGWDDIQTKTAVFVGPDNTPYNVILEQDNTCKVPWEVIKAPGFTVSVYGGDLITANKADVTVIESGYIEGQAPPTPTPDVYNQLVTQVQTERQLAQTAADSAGQDAVATAADRADVTAKAAQVTTDTTRVSTDKADVAADKLVVISERQLTEIARNSAQQAYSDLLAMMGTDIATLTGGKLTPSQIPAIAVTDTFVVASEAAMLALTAQTGDVAIRTDENKTYILQGSDPAVLTNWQRLQSPTNYADEAGHAATADNANNANTINNKRIVGMTQSQYDAAVKDPDTFYIVTPD